MHCLRRRHGSNRAIHRRPAFSEVGSCSLLFFRVLALPAIPPPATPVTGEWDQTLYMVPERTLDPCSLLGGVGS
jgi:hypothetical protein